MAKKPKFETTRRVITRAIDAAEFVMKERYRKATALENSHRMRQGGFIRCTVNPLRDSVADLRALLRRNCRNCGNPRRGMFISSCDDCSRSNEFKDNWRPRGAK